MDKDPDGRADDDEEAVDWTDEEDSGDELNLFPSSLNVSIKFDLDDKFLDDRDED